MPADHQQSSALPSPLAAKVFTGLRHSSMPRAWLYSLEDYHTLRPTTPRAGSPLSHASSSCSTLAELLRRLVYLSPLITRDSPSTGAQGERGRYASCPGIAALSPLSGEPNHRTDGLSLDPTTIVHNTISISTMVTNCDMFHLAAKIIPQTKPGIG